MNRLKVDVVKFARTDTEKKEWGVRHTIISGDYRETRIYDRGGKVVSPAIVWELDEEIALSISD